MRIICSVFLMMLVSGFFLRADESPAGVNPVSENSKTVNEMKVRLALDDIQAKTILSIFESSESQEKIDTDLFKTSPSALIRAAWRRREIIDRKVMDILNENQREYYEKYIREREKDEELFRLKHGLLLNGEQSIQAELVISEYSIRLRELYSRLEYHVKSGEDRKRKNSLGGDLLKSRSKGLERRTPQTERSVMTPLEKIKEINREKSRRYQEFLTDEQKKRLPEYEKFQDDELESYVRSLRK